MEDPRLNKIIKKVNGYFNNKYPTTYPIIGLSEANLKQLVTKVLKTTDSHKGDITSKKQLLSQNINNLISLIERKINTSVYSENRNNRVVNTNQYTLDPQVDMSSKGYVDDFKPKSLVGDGGFEKSKWPALADARRGVY